MIVDTHLLISNIIYKYLSNNMKFKLDRVAFAYGNIKPDFTNSDIKCPHTLEESLYRINKYSEILIVKIYLLNNFIYFRSYLPFYM